MHRERVSIAAAYWVGSLEFFGILIFHGTLRALGSQPRSGRMDPPGSGQLFLRPRHHPAICFYENAAAAPWTFTAYCVFICVCILSTLDSGYVALKWYFQEGVARSKNPLLTFLPKRLLTSPIPAFILAGVIALVAAVLRLELEYFMIFYATFFVGYSALGIARCYIISPANAIPQVKMFCIGSLAVVICAFGYFLRYPHLHDSGLDAAAGFHRLAAPETRRR